MSMSYDQGREMAMHKEMSLRTGMAVYFCDPHIQWQCGSNENTNVLVSQHLPKGTDLSGCSQEQFDAISDQINNRPRKRSRFTIPAVGLSRNPAQQFATFNPRSLNPRVLHFSLESTVYFN